VKPARLVAFMADAVEWHVEIVTKGPYGHVIYHENSHRASFYWEFGGRDVVAIIHVGRPAEWSEKYPWAAGRREVVLQRLAGDVIRQKAPTCVASIDDAWGSIRLREREG